MTRAVGVEINDSRIKLVAVENTSKRTRILRYHEETIAVDPAKTWEDAAAEALKQAFEKSKISKARVVASIDSGDAVLRDLSLPFKEEEQIRRTFTAELESLIHNYSIEDLVVDYFRTGETDKGAVVLAAAVPKAVIGKRLKMLEQAGIDPVALDLDVTALYNTLLNGGAVDTDEPFLVIYGTPKFTKIIFVENKRPKSIRTIRFSFPAPETVAKEKEERKKASQWETREVEGPVPYLMLPAGDVSKFSDLDFETQSKLIEILAKEISRFLLANAASATPSQILLTGEYEHEEAAHLLEAATRIPVKTFNLLEVIDHPFKQPLPEQSAKLGVPLGLALKGCDVDALGLDFRRGEFSFKKKYDVLKSTALVTVELILVFLGAFALHLYFKSKEFRQGEHNVCVEQANLFDSVAAQEVPPDMDPKQAYTTMKAFYEKLLKFYGAEHPIKISALQLSGRFFEALSRISSKYGAQKVGGDDLWIMLDALDISNNTNSGQEGTSVLIRARARNTDQATLILTEMKQTSEPAFLTANFEGPIQPDKDGAVRFTIRAERKNK